MQYFVSAHLRLALFLDSSNFYFQEENTHKINSLTISDSLPENSRRMGEENTVLGIK